MRSVLYLRMHFLNLFTRVRGKAPDTYAAKHPGIIYPGSTLSYLLG